MARPSEIKAYFRPQSLSEAHELLMASPEEARLLGGGTDLLNALSGSSKEETRIVSLRDVKELREIKQTRKEEVFIGAMVSHREAADSPFVNRHFPALAKACGLVGSPSIRNRGTIGGNIVTASPSADSIPPLMAYEARAVLWTPSGEREVPVADFFTGPSGTIMEKGDILKGLLLKLDSERVADYEKLGMRRAMEIAIVNLCVSLVAAKKTVCKDLRICLGAVAPTPIRAVEAEDMLRGLPLTAESIKKAAGAAMDAAEPISDIRASADYRRHMVGVLVEKLLSRLLGF